MLCPMYAVLFHSTRALAHDDVYEAWSKRMESAVTSVDGYLSHVGYPLVGDALYGGKAVPSLSRQGLHAWRLSQTIMISAALSGSGR